MKYLKLYEAFKSKGISSTIKFLKSKVGKNSSNAFIESLRNFMSNLDYPIDQISDHNIKYMSAKKALLLKPHKRVTNQKGIWVLKYWFSIKDGYLGYSSTGNEVREFSELNSSQGHDGLRQQRRFSDDELNYIKQNIIRNGEIWPVNEYRKLKSGDVVIGCFDGSFDYDKLALAKIYIDYNDNRRTYAVQNVSDGSVPNNSEWRSYCQYGSRTWWIFDNSELGGDHSRLHHWRPSSEELHYIEPPVEKEEDKEIEQEKEEDPLTWNLPLSNRYAVTNWGRGSSISMDKIKSADFALVLYFDGLLNPEEDAEFYQRPSETKVQRKEEKEGATKLMSDEEIKKMNIERYVKSISSSLNITETEFSDLSKIVTKHLAREFSYLSLWIGSPNYANISEFSESLYNIIDSSDVDKKYWVDRTKKLYESQVKSYYDRLLKYQESKKYLKGDSFLKKIFDDILKLGEVIYRYFLELKIETIDELWLVRQKFNTLVNYMKMSRNQLSYHVRETFNGFRYPEEMNYYFDQYRDNYSEADYKLDLEKLQRMTTFIKSL